MVTTGRCVKSCNILTSNKSYEKGESCFERFEIPYHGGVIGRYGHSMGISSAWWPSMQLDSPARLSPEIAHSHFSSHCQRSSCYSVHFLGTNRVVSKARIDHTGVACTRQNTNAIACYILYSHGITTKASPPDIKTPFINQSSSLTSPNSGPVIPRILLSNKSSELANRFTTLRLVLGLTAPDI